MTKKSLEAKDLITIGIFTAIYFVVLFMCGMTGYIPILYAFLPLIIPVVCGIPYMLYLTRVKYFGMATITGVICGGMMVLTGHTILPLVSGALFGLLADVIFKAGQYKSAKCSIVGYAVFSLWIMGMMMPFWVMRDSYIKMMEGSMGADYTNAIMSIFDKIAWAFPIMCVVGGVLGAFFGFAVLKKHFKKRGSREKRYGMQDGIMQSVKPEYGATLDPRTKLLVLLAVNLPAFTADGWQVLTFAAAIPLSLLLFSRRSRLAVICAALYTAALLCDVFLVDTTSGIANVLVTIMSGVICRMLPGILMGMYLFATTTVSEFVAAMERMRVPKQIIIPFSVMFRFFPTIGEESVAITDAMKMRGISFGKTRGGPVSLMEYRLVPLFISCVKIGDELSCAALTRGMGSPVKRTNICKIGFRAADIIYLSLAAITVCLFVMDGGYWG